MLEPAWRRVEPASLFAATTAGCWDQQGEELEPASNFAWIGNQVCWNGCLGLLRLCWNGSLGLLRHPPHRGATKLASWNRRTINLLHGFSWRSCNRDGGDNVLLYPSPDFATTGEIFCYIDFMVKLQPRGR